MKILQKEIQQFAEQLEVPSNTNRKTKSHDKFIFGVKNHII